MEGLNFELNYEGFEDYLVFKELEPSMFGAQVFYRFKFENGYGASVVKSRYTYGGLQDLWELAVISWVDDEWGLNYDTPITDDVEGYLTDEDVRGLLGQIKELPHMGY